MSTPIERRRWRVAHARNIGLVILLIALVIAGWTTVHHVMQSGHTKVATITEVTPVGGTITDPDSGDGYELMARLPDERVVRVFAGPGRYAVGNTVRILQDGNVWNDYRWNTDALTAAAIVAGLAAVILLLDWLIRRGAVSSARRRKEGSGPGTFNLLPGIVLVVIGVGRPIVDVIAWQVRDEPMESIVTLVVWTVLWTAAGVGYFWLWRVMRKDLARRAARSARHGEQRAEQERRHG